MTLIIKIILNALEKLLFSHMDIDEYIEEDEVMYDSEDEYP